MGTFSDKNRAQNVQISIPVPKNTAKVNCSPNVGKAKYKAEKGAIVWKIKSFNGRAEYELRGEAHLATSVNKKVFFFVFL